MITTTCDKCKKSFSESVLEDELELQEFVHISFTAGYASAFLDGDRIKFDFCSACFYDMVKDCLPKTSWNQSLDNYFQEPRHIDFEYPERDY